MDTEACLGIIDWGIGGVGLVGALDRLVPGLPVLYWSDAGATPYGLMDSDELTDRLMRVVTALAERGATEVVLACNAASTVVSRLGSAPVAVEGIIAHGLASVPEDISSVGVVGGQRTIDAGHYERGLARPGRLVLSRVAQPLSAHIEAGRAGSARFNTDLADVVAPLHRVAALVLACTHYPAARRWFAAACPTRCSSIRPGTWPPQSPTAIRTRHRDPPRPARRFSPRVTRMRCAAMLLAPGARC